MSILKGPYSTTGWLLIFALIPHVINLPWLLSGLMLLPLALLPLIGAKAKFAHWSRGGIVLLLLLSASLIYFSGNWLNGENAIALLGIVLGLKCLELRQPRDYRVVLLGSLLLLALASLELRAGLAALYLLLAFIILMMGLLELELSAYLATSEEAKPLDDPLSEAKARRGLFSLIQSLKLGLLVLPITIILFICMPRIQGPLWDLGLVIGLPIELSIDPEKRQQGIKASLRAGQVSRLKQSDAPVLVAEFKSVVPYKSELYWRGAVFDYYDGNVWRLPAGWDNRSQLLAGAFKQRGAVDQVLSKKSNAVEYEARVSANGSRWLYALDVPTGRSTESFISADLQLLAIRRLDREFNYGQSAWLEYQGGRPITEAQRARYLQLPAQANPELRSWGKALSGLSTEEVIQSLRVHLAQGNYQITQTPDIEESMTSLDEFFFRRKEGGIEHLAGAAAMALRAAGVPTRLVSGYRGGNLIALTNFIVVRQGNAHVWVEAWQDATGWQRVEALDFVAPPTLENRSRALLVKPQAQKAEQAKTSGEAAAARVDKGAEQPVAQAQARSPKSPVSANKVCQLTRLKPVFFNNSTWRSGL